MPLVLLLRVGQQANRKACRYPRPPLAVSIKSAPGKLATGAAAEGGGVAMKAEARGSGRDQPWTGTRYRRPSSPRANRAFFGSARPVWKRSISVPLTLNEEQSGQR